MPTWVARLILVLLSGVSVSVAVILAVQADVLPTPPSQPGTPQIAVLAAVIAAACAAVAVGIDLQTAISSRLGSLFGTSVFGSMITFVAILGWAGVDAAAFDVTLLNPEWSTRTFHFDVKQNVLALGAVVGLSALVVIRSKLFTAGKVDVGFEWVYLWTQALVIDSVNQTRIKRKRIAVSKFAKYVTDLASYPHFFTEFQQHVALLLKGKPAEIANALSSEITNIQKNFKGDPNTALAPRQALVNTVLDYLDPAEMHDQFP